MEEFFHFLFISIYFSNNSIGDYMIIKDEKIKRKIIYNAKEKHKLKNSLTAFFIGGIIGLLAQLLFELYHFIFLIEDNLSITLVSATFIFIAFILTCLGVFDKLAIISKAGILIPITGFANSITSCALEGKTEGLIFGIGSNMFSLIGSVCTYGIVSSIILGIIYYFIKVI